MSTERTEPPVTAFMLVKTTPEWLAMSVAERVEAFTTHVVPVVEARTRGVRSRFYDTEFYSPGWPRPSDGAIPRLLARRRASRFADAGGLPSQLVLQGLGVVQG
jgi:Darcynin, domain of unknown function